MKWMKLYFLFALLTLFMSCQKGDGEESNKMELYSIAVNGAELIDGSSGIDFDLTLTLVFSAGLSKEGFESAFTLDDGSGATDLDFTYSNNASKVVLTASLKEDTEYRLRIDDRPIGINGQQLAGKVERKFRTRKIDIITAMPPCTNVGDCLDFVFLEGSLGMGKFEFYSNYPINEEEARWQALTQAVIVVHGASINPDTYFGYMTNTLQALSLSESTVLVAPFFKTSATGDPNTFYWSSTAWREGRESRNSNKISSFDALDQLIDRLADTTYFPKLTKIVVTGQSSGALFTHIYAPSNGVEEAYPHIDFDYLVSESQYFYYPDGRRVDEGSNQLYTPVGCTGYDIWPFGFSVTPTYVNGLTADQFNTRFIQRGIKYILGNGTGTDNSLNTTDCGAALLGSSRYNRGDNMHRYMDLAYPGQHAHTRLVVPGVTHDGSAIYRSEEFKICLLELFN